MCGAGVDGAVKDAGPGERERSGAADATARVMSVHCPAPPLPDDLEVKRFQKLLTMSSKHSSHPGLFIPNKMKYVLMPTTQNLYTFTKKLSFILLL